VPYCGAVVEACVQPVPAECAGEGAALAAVVVACADEPLPPLPKAVGTSQTASARTTAATSAASTFLDTSPSFAGSKRRLPSSPAAAKALPP